MDYLVRWCGPDGKFRYRVHLDPRVEPSPRYNVLRHAGAIYALGMYHGACPNEQVRSTLVRAGEFLRRECIAAVPGRDDLLAVWSPPELVLRDEPLQAKLGGTGLGLVALLMVERAAPGTTPPDELRKLGQFLVWLQKEDGSFYSKYIPAEGGRWDEWTSLYYPGEAALGLVMLHDQEPSPVWLETAAKALGHLARTRQGTDDVPADHWALIATARLMPVFDRYSMPVSRELLVQHAVQICEGMLSNQKPRPDDSTLAGCFTGDGRTSPTATQVEGLLAALEFLPEEERELRARIEEAVARGLAFLLRAQVTSGEHVGGVPRAIGPLAGDFRLSDVEGFNRRAGEIRIDYVQHATSAMMQYNRVFFGDSHDGAPARR